MPSRTQSLITVFTARRGEGKEEEERNATRISRTRCVVTSLTLEFAQVLAQLYSRVSFSTRNNSRYVRLRFITRSLDFSSPVIFLYVHSKGIPLPRNHFGSFLLSFFFETEREIIEPCRIHAIFPSNSPRKKGENPRVVTVTG